MVSAPGGEESPRPKDRRRSDRAVGGMAAIHPVNSQRGTAHARPRCTPWQPEGTLGPQGPKRLAGELIAFEALVGLTPQERRRREGLVATVRRLASQHWPEAVAVVHGSFALGTSWWDSPVEVSVEGCGKIRSHQIGAFSVLGKVLVSEVCIDVGRARLQIEALNGVIANITFSEILDLPASGLIAAVSQHLAEAPAAATVASVVRYVLSHACADLVNPELGGVAETALLAMAIHSCKASGNPDDPEKALVEFLTLFGGGLDTARRSACLDGTSPPRPGEHARDSISVLHPADTGSGHVGNLAARCTRFREVQAHLASCLIALQQGGGDEVMSPLSTLVPHGPLWARARAVAESHVTQGRQQMCSPTAPESYAPAATMQFSTVDSMTWGGDCWPPGMHPAVFPGWCKEGWHPQAGTSFGVQPWRCEQPCDSGWGARWAPAGGGAHGHREHGAAHPPGSAASHRLRSSQPTSSANSPQPPPLEELLPDECEGAALPPTPSLLAGATATERQSSPSNSSSGEIIVSAADSLRAAAGEWSSPLIQPMSGRVDDPGADLDLADLAAQFRSTHGAVADAP
eukprot:TRINITY_DN6972_c0_g1_i2.p1 TRINITY_DN6972_c0_g1~~TRINITY_DN6972_c0_g1_i2.p1  ORF type:complete len:575 (+),score=85.31 TRINITY_DN6972_c0_g1_i2:72-1796(+)